MAIGFAKVEFIKRSEGRNSCQLSAYLSRSRVEFQGNCVLSKKTYDYSYRESPPLREVLIPNHANENLRVSEVLWNLVEKKEKRKDAQVAMHLVLALPDDKELSDEDRIELARSYVEKFYVSKGLAVELVVHPPNRKALITKDNDVLGLKKGEKLDVISKSKEGYILARNLGTPSEEILEIGNESRGVKFKDHNWHAHALISTRRVASCGNAFNDYKAIDLMPTVKKGKVVNGPDNGQLWTDHQNAFFKEKGYTLRVDKNGLVSQEHLGPYRLRARIFDLLDEHGRRIEQNREKASDPSEILQGITKKQSVFSENDVNHFLNKHTPEELVQSVREKFWKLDEIVKLQDSHGDIKGYSTQKILEEERQALRICGKLQTMKHQQLSLKKLSVLNESLTKEQQKAFSYTMQQSGLACVKGYAGTGKSYLLKAVKKAYEGGGYRVRAFGPDNATVGVLKGKGFSSSENVYKFLFCLHYGSRKIRSGKEIWIIDESGKIGNKPTLELLKLANSHKVKVVFVGDPSQLSSVERSGIFKVLCEKFGSANLEEIHRQREEVDKAISKNLAKGDVDRALHSLERKEKIHWVNDKFAAYEKLVLDWDIHTKHTEHKECSKHIKHNEHNFSTNDVLVIAGTNKDVHVLNELIREVRKERGEVSCREVSLLTTKGVITVSKGDLIEFRKNDKELNVTNGLKGKIIEVSNKRCSVSVTESEKKSRIISFDPRLYQDLQLGYATTYYRSQGMTVRTALVLHSPHLNKQMAYVGLSRHVDKVGYYVSKDESPDMEHLKSIAGREGEKISSVGLFSDVDIERRQLGEINKEKIASLKHSDYLGDRVKGNLLSTWDTLRKGADKIIEGSQDKRIDKEFFKLEKNVEKSSQTVVEQEKDETKSRSILFAGDFTTLEGAKEFIKGAAKKQYDVENINSLEASNSSLEVSGREVFLWDRKNIENLIPTVSVLLQKGAKRIHVVDPEWIKKSFSEEWKLGEELPKEVKSFALSKQLKGITFDRLRYTTTKTLGIDKEDLGSRQMVADAVARYLVENKEEVASLLKGKSLHDKNTALGILGINLGAMLLDGRDGHVNGKVEDRVMQWQLSVFRMGATKEPLEEVLTKATEVMSSIPEKDRSIDTISLCAVHRVLNKLPMQELDGEKIDFLRMIENEKDALETQIAKGEALNCRSQIKEKGISHDV
ncbi:MAG: AAA family ATPase [Rhabdochlamydiaceae bacterium]|nr:AAA family ATPase [Candidatus Amphrikana amoebophyrae]